MNTALVTGVTGMLGSYVAERLVASGWRVRGLVREPERSRWVSDLGVDVVLGDLLDARSLVEAVGGCGVVIHTAAAIGSGASWARFHAGNVQGTRNVLAAAASTGARLVHVSSTAVFGRERYFEVPTDEDAPLPQLPARDAYGRSKQEAERVVLEAHGTGRGWGVVVRPPVMYGRRDRQFVPRIAPVLERGLFPIIRGGRAKLPIVHASAVAEGAIRAATSDRAGGRVYHLTNDFDVTVADLVRDAGEGLGRRIWTPRVPFRMARVGFEALSVSLRLAGRSDLAVHTAGTLEMLSRDNPFTSQRAREELDWSPSVPPSSGLPEAFRWWKKGRRARDRRVEPKEGSHAVA